jgi:aminopeptidase N
MYHTLLGPEGFRKGMDLYFERHDGSAVTCDDFRAAMADANGADLEQFERWYLQVGDPSSSISSSTSSWSSIMRGAPSPAMTSRQTSVNHWCCTPCAPPLTTHAIKLCQAGTPVVEAKGVWDAAGGRYRLTLSQATAATVGQPSKLPFHIPVAVGLLARDGSEVRARGQHYHRRHGHGRHALDRHHPSLF